MLYATWSMQLWSAINSNLQASNNLFKQIHIEIAQYKIKRTAWEQCMPHYHSFHFARTKQRATNTAFLAYENFEALINRVNSCASCMHHFFFEFATSDSLDCLVAAGHSCNRANLFCGVDFARAHTLHTHAYIHTCIHTYMHSWMHADARTHRHARAHRHTHRHRETYSHTHTHIKNAHTDANTQAHTDTHAEIDRETHSHTNTNTHTRTKTHTENVWKEIPYPEASRSFCSAQSYQQGHLCPTLRANPFPEVTDPFCRLPLPTNSPTVSLLSPLKRIQVRAASPLERMHEIQKLR